MINFTSTEVTDVDVITFGLPQNKLISSSSAIGYIAFAINDHHRQAVDLYNFTVAEGYIDTDFTNSAISGSSSFCPTNVLLA